MFDVKYYAQKNSDIAKAFQTNYLGMIRHFKDYGINEGRASSPEFDVAKYKNKNSDLSKAFNNNWKQYFWHYMLFGKNEGRINLYA